MNPALDSSGETHASRHAAVRDALMRLNADLLVVTPTACGISERQVAHLITALSDLGPVFSQFGRYLATRHDLFRPEACLLLGEVGTVALPSGDALQQQHLHDFPDGSASWLETLRPEASRSDHLVHFYRWPGRPHLSLRVLNPDFLNLWDQDHVLLEKLAGPLKRIWPHIRFKEVLREFREKVETCRDLDGTAQTYRRFAASHEEADLLGPKRFVLPQIADEFCAPDILSILEPAPGPDASTAQDAVAKLFRSDPGNSVRVQTARDLCLVWLRQALRGIWYPEDPSLRHLGLTADDTLCILGGPLATLDSESQDFLFRYLCAVAANQPDVASDILVANLHPGRHAKDLGEVRDLFRQIVPFRDGQINENGNHELFAEHVVAQWRVIQEAGYHVDPLLLSFLRSFAAVARLAHALSPRRDTFKDAIYEFRWTDSLANFRNMFTFAAAARQGQDWLNLMMEIPEKMNLAAQGRGLAQTTPVPKGKKSSAPSAPQLLFLAHLFLLALLGWLVHTAVTVGSGSLFLPTLLTIALIGVGISMLRSLSPRN